mgnify:CR=1 FL=1
MLLEPGNYLRLLGHDCGLLLREFRLADSIFLHLLHALLELAHHFFHSGFTLLIQLTDWYVYFYGRN